ncbi:SLC13 family permease [Thermoleptolyngbya oregonensis NK1-22]|uniref:SLC13 family permease n=2 Tax=Thermoleptolyngbya TaxID=2303528 RepID=A0AA96Y8N6_9CYAN|nr:SLC13 family permease [Thermoleptolyngbya oregonensis NK1-22]
MEWWMSRAKPKRFWAFWGLFCLGASVFLGFCLPGLLVDFDSWNWHAGLTILVILNAFFLNAFTSLPPHIVFLGGLAILMIVGTLDTEDALSGFSNPGMITIAILYVVVAGLQQTGALSWITQHILGLPRSQERALVRLILPVMCLSSILNNTPVVAMFIPVVNEWCRKLKISPSKLMIPLSYAAIFGGVCTLIGTSTNLVVNGLLISETSHPGLNLLDISRVGFPCAIAGTTFLILTHKWLLPKRKSAFGMVTDPRQYTVEMLISANSQVEGKTVEQAGLRHLPNLYLAEIIRGETILPAVSPKEVLQEQDRLVFVGAVESIVDLHRFRGLYPATDQVFKLDTPRLGRCLLEAVVSNVSPLTGKTIREIAFRTRYNAVVIAVARHGDRLPGKIGDICIQAGDVLLLEANPTFEEQYRSSKDFYLVSSVPDSTPLNHEKAPFALLALGVMVVLASFGWMDMLSAATLAAMVILITGCCSPIKAISSIEWPVLLVIAATLGIGKAMESTGAAGAIAAILLEPAGTNPWIALNIIYGTTTLLTEIVTNNAAAALVFPIAIALSKDLGVNYLPFVIAIMVAASASFATPIGYQTNLMVYGPGGYKFSDFVKVGIPINLVFWVVSIVIIPAAFPF